MTDSKQPVGRRYDSEIGLRPDHEQMLKTLEGGSAVSSPRLRSYLPRRLNPAFSSLSAIRSETC